MVISICVLIFYASVSVHTRHETITRPTQAAYEAVYRKYPDTLEYPCTRITIPYEDFMDATPYFHQVCYSDFVSQRSIDCTFEENSTALWSMDVRKV